MPDLRRSSTPVDGLRNRVRYRFDTLLSRGTWAVLLWLGAITVVAVLVSAGLLAAFDVDLSGSQENSWVEDAWQSLLRILDTGTMAADVGWGRRVLALIVTVFGVLVAGTLIGIIANGVEQRVDAMRRGRSTVVESGHVVILGASNRLSVIIEQLALASRRRRANVIVVLADREPVQLSDEARVTAAALHGSRVVFRRGDPSRPSDLALVRLRDARAVIVLAGEGAHGDAGVVKAVLATGVELGGFDRVPIIAELGDPDAADSLVRACGGSVHPVVAAQAVARITAFALREPGLNQVVEELLDFRGCDIHLWDVSDLAGMPFGESVFRFAKARPIGRMRADGDVDLNPDPRALLEQDDQLIVIADDDTTPELAPDVFSSSTPPATPPVRFAVTRQEEHVLIVGWNALGTQLVAHLAEFAAPGSTVEVVYDATLFGVDPPQVPRPPGLDVSLTPTTAATWQASEDVELRHHTSIVLLAYRRATSPDEADSRTLLSHMLLRRQLDARAGTSPRIVVELLDSDTVDLARITAADDYVVSDAITSRIMAQLAEQPHRRDVLLRLYAPDGPSVRLVGADVLGLSGDVDYGRVVTSAYAVGLVALGWRSGDDVVVLNPRITDQVSLRHGDQIVAVG